MSLTNKNNIDRTFHIRACRICLDSKCSKMVKINEQSELLKQLEYCLGLQISDPDVPQNLCELCVKNVKEYSKFKELCYQSDKFWKSLTTVKCCAEKLKNNSLVKNELIDIKKNTNDGYETDNTNFDSFQNDFSNIMTEDFNNKEIKQETFKIVIQHEKPTDERLYNTKKTVKLHNNKKNNSTMSSQKNIIMYSSHNVESEVQNIFICKWCHRKYESKSCYLKHVKLCNTEKQSATSQYQENNPGTEIKPEYTPKIINDFCGVCKFSTKHLDNLTTHLEEHWTNNDLKCELCEFVAKDRAAMAAHRYTHYTKKTRFLCHICKKKTKSKLTLEFHYRKVHLNKSGGLCSQPKCDKIYNSWRSWKRHETFHNHPGYICDICGQKYQHKHLIVEHLMNHINPPQHVCDVCGKTFLRLRNLKAHFKKVHVKSDPQKCSHCDRIFKHEHYLKIHLKQLTMEKIWKCDFCPKKYSMLYMLKNHLKRHSDEKPHCCHICGSRYKAKGQLLIHMRNHSGDRPYKCVQCTKAFKSSQLLKRHAMMHTGILPHKCIHCEKMFHCKNRMMKHCAVRHKDLENKNDTDLK